MCVCVYIYIKKYFIFSFIKNLLSRKDLGSAVNNLNLL